MKIVNTIVKVVLALAAIAGLVYVIATYGDKIVAWAKKLLGSCKCCCDEECCGECQCEECECCEEPCECCEAAEEVAEEVPAEDAPAAEEADFEA